MFLEINKIPQIKVDSFLLLCTDASQELGKVPVNVISPMLSFCKLDVVLDTSLIQFDENYENYFLLICERIVNTVHPLPRFTGLAVRYEPL